MTIKVYDGSTWQPQKSLRIYDGSAWSTAKKGWIYNGSAWSQFYPEYPQNTASPSVSGTATQGNTLSCTTGTWTSTDAYNPVSYSYQWTRAGTNISGATSSTYATVVADVGNAVACKVTATNNRGDTTVTSSNSITVTSAIPGPPSALVLTDSTDTPPTPGATTVSNVTTTSLNFSFGAATGTFTAYEVLTSNSNHVVSGLNQSTRTGSVTGGTAGEAYYISAFTTNTNCKITASWTAGTNATSYDVYVGGTYRGNTTSTSYTYTTGAVGTYSVVVYSRNAAGAETTGVSGSKALAKKYSAGGTAASGNFLANYTVTWNANGGTVSPASNTVTQGNSVTAPTPTRSGYRFNGWYNASSGGTLIVNAGNSYTPTSSITLYAQWSQIITPTISSLTVSTSDTPGTLMTVNWTATNQSSWSLTSSPATGGVSGGSSWSGTSQVSKYVGVGTAGTTYTFTLTITSSSNDTASSSVNYTPPTAATKPSDPTNGGGTYSTGTDYVTNATFTSSASGTTPITYYWSVYSGTSSSGPWSFRNSGNFNSSSLSTTLSIPQQSWTQATYGNWSQYNVYASNGGGSSNTLTWTI